MWNRNKPGQPGWATSGHRHEKLQPRQPACVLWFLGQGALASVQLFLDLDPGRVASIHWKIKDYLVGISVLQTLVPTAWSPLLSKLSEFSITARKEKKEKIPYFPLLRERSLTVHGVILKVNWGRKLRAFDICKGGRDCWLENRKSIFGPGGQVSSLIPSSLLSGLGKKCVIKAHWTSSTNYRMYVYSESPQ